MFVYVYLGFFHSIFILKYSIHCLNGIYYLPILQYQLYHIISHIANLLAYMDHFQNFLLKLIQVYQETINLIINKMNFLSPEKLNFELINSIFIFNYPSNIRTNYCHL